MGGLGTRLGELTRETPKPLLSVSGRPFLAHMVDELRRFGFEHVLLLAGFSGRLVEAALGHHEDVTVRVEPEPLGTAGALRFAADDLQPEFLLLNGDSLFDINVWDLAAFAPEATAAMALRPVADAQRYGAVSLEGRRVRAFLAKGAAGPGLINGGVVRLSRRVLDLIPAGRAVSLEAEIYPALAAQGELAGRTYDRPFIDIGVPADFARAQEMVGRTLRRGAVIFDRDGVLNRDVGYAHRPEQIEWVEGAREAVKAVNDAGLFAFVATNQAGVAHGYYPETAVHELHRWMNRELIARGAHIDRFAHSPYHPQGREAAYRRESDCRKPGPGLVLQLLDAFPVDRARVVMIGDRSSDVEAAHAAGVRGELFAGGDLLEAVAPLIRELAP